jgi:hypothetical protein
MCWAAAPGQTDVDARERRRSEPDLLLRGEAARDRVLEVDLAEAIDEGSGSARFEEGLLPTGGQERVEASVPKGPHRDQSRMMVLR